MKIILISAIVITIISYVAYTYYKKSIVCDENLIKHKMKMEKIDSILNNANVTILTKEIELKKIGISLKEANEMLLKKEEELKKVNAILTDVNTTISTKESELKKMGLTIKEANEMLAKKDEELKKINILLSEATTTISTKEEELKKIHNILNDANATIATKESELKKMGLTIKEANEIIDKKEEELKKINAILDNANISISTKESELKKMGLTIKEANEIIAKKDEELKKVNAILENANISISSKEEELRKLGLTIKEINEIIVKKEEELKKTNAILTDANTTISTKESELKKLGFTVKEANEMLVKKDEELKKLGLGLSDANEMLVKKDEELKNLGLSLVKKEEELKKLRLIFGDLDATIVKKDEDIKTLTRKMSEIVFDYDRKINERTDLINKANGTISALNDELSQKINEFNIADKKNTETVTNLTNEIVKLKQNIVQKEKEFNDQILQINESLSKTSALLKEKEAEISRLEVLRQTQSGFAREMLPRQQKDWNTIVDNILSGLSQTASLNGTWIGNSSPIKITINGDHVKMEADRRIMTGKLSGKKVTLFDQTGAKAGVFTLSLKDNGQLFIEERNLLFNKGINCNMITIFDKQRGHLNLAEINVYDINKKIIPIESKAISMSGKLTNPVSNLIDRNINTFAQNDGISRSITINFQSPIIISSVVIINRQDCCKTRANGLMLKASLNGKDVYTSMPVKDWSGSTSYENGGTDNTNPNGYNYITFKLPEPEPIISQHPIITPFDALDTTYSDAVLTCEQKGMRLCNADELCNGRTPDANLDIFGTNDNWIAVGDRKDEWLTYNRSGDRVCKTHTQISGGTPSWSQNYDGNWKRAAKCCENPKLDKIPDTKCSAESQPSGMKLFVIRDNILMGDDDNNRMIVVPLTSRNTKINGANKLTVEILKGEYLSLVSDVKLLK